MGEYKKYFTELSNNRDEMYFGCNKQSKKVKGLKVCRIKL